MLKLLQRFESMHLYDTARKESSILTYYLSENKIPNSKNINIFSLSYYCLEDLPSQYRSKYSIRSTQRLIEGKNFEFSAISKYFAGLIGVRDTGCPL